MKALKENPDPSKHGSIEFQFFMDSTTITSNDSLTPYYSRTIYQTQTKSDSTSFQFYRPEQASMMQVAFKGIWQTINDFIPVNLNQIDSLWTTLLSRKGIYNAHFIDFTLGKDTLLATTLPPGKNPTHLLATQKIGINLDDSIGMQGFILSPDKAIFKELKIIFFASFFLIILTTVSYIYLIRTILRQKTIAQMKNDFVNNMTHELKTPITVTYSAIDALQTFNFVEQKEIREEYFTLCRQQLKHLSGLVEKILSMALDGFTLAKMIRQIDTQTPILFLTARSSVEDLVTGFRLGGNDYLKKTFDMEELIVRIQALLNRQVSIEEPKTDLFFIGQYVFHVTHQTLQLGDQTQTLSHRESEILRMLCMHANNILHRKPVLLKLWGDDTFFNARSMDVFITKLRKKLKADPHVQIVNIRGIGYKLIF